MDYEEQLKKWVNGESLHLGNRPDGQCCPDFSCCEPTMLWPQQKRQEFLQADEEKRRVMLMGALSQAMDFHEKRRVRII